MQLEFWREIERLSLAVYSNFSGDFLDASTHPMGGAI
jgi:hypothetical protein